MVGQTPTLVAIEGLEREPAAAELCTDLRSCRPLSLVRGHDAPDSPLSASVIAELAYAGRLAACLACATRAAQLHDALGRGPRGIQLLLEPKQLSSILRAWLIGFQRAGFLEPLHQLGLGFCELRRKVIVHRW